VSVDGVLKADEQGLGDHLGVPEQVVVELGSICKQRDTLRVSLYTKAGLVYISKRPHIPSNKSKL